jgi:ribonuclease HI
MKLCNYIQNFHWYIPAEVSQLLPNLTNVVSHVPIPRQAKEDFLVWNHTPSGILTLKDAYEFKKQHFPKIQWTKTIWSKDFPPSKSLLVWRLMLNKLPTDDILTTRGCSLPSMCSLCGKHPETSFHLFFECMYAVNLWCWLASTLNRTLHFQTPEDMWTVANNSWNPQCKVVIIATMINIINSIWYARNQLRFNDKMVPWKSSLSNVIVCTSLCGNLTTDVASSNISNFVILKKFNVTLHPPRAPKIIEVIWKPPPPNWVKCNTDGSSNNLLSSCGGIFRDNNSNTLLCFAEHKGTGNAFHAELCGAMRAIELAEQRNWSNL